MERIFCNSQKQISGQKFCLNSPELCYSEFQPSSSLYNQDLDFPFNFKNKLDTPIPDEKIIHLLKLKE